MINHKTRSIVIIITGLIEIILLGRLLLKLVGADINNTFISGYYSATNILVAVFNNYVGQVAITGNRANMVFEPGSIMAIIVFIFIGWLIIDVLSIRTIKQNKKIGKEE